jgi:hypothetical protein
MLSGSESSFSIKTRRRSFYFAMTASRVLIHPPTMTRQLSLLWGYTKRQPGVYFAQNHAA